MRRIGLTALTVIVLAALSGAAGAASSSPDAKAKAGCAGIVSLPLDPTTYTATVKATRTALVKDFKASKTPGAKALAGPLQKASTSSAMASAQTSIIIWCAGNHAVAVPATAATTTTTVAAVPAQHFAGSGDTVIDLNPPVAAAAIIHVAGNAGNRYFGVTSFSAANAQIDLLVNTTSAYDGTRVLGLTSNAPVAHLQVQATGSWMIDVAGLSFARMGQSPGHFEGDGDSILVVRGSPTRAHIVGNAGARYFGVTGYNTSRSLLVNTTAAYDGTVLVPSVGNFLFDIQAVGHWAIDFS